MRLPGNSEPHCGKADDSVHVDPRLLVAAHGGIGLDARCRPRHVQVALYLGHEVALAAHLEREAALADLDRPVSGGLRRRRAQIPKVTCAAEAE